MTLLHNPPREKRTVLTVIFMEKNKGTIQVRQVCSYLAKNNSIYLEFSPKT